jgi:hypothetical protein
MDVVQCPHCHRRVLPSSTGACPSCAKVVTDLTGVDPSLRSVLLFAGTTLPQVCAGCGGTPSGKLELSNEDGAQAMKDAAFNVFGIGLGLLTGFGVFRRSPQRAVWRLSVPVCAACKADGKPRVLGLHEDEAVRLLVHERFAAALPPE